MLDITIQKGQGISIRPLFDQLSMGFAQCCQEYENYKRVEVSWSFLRWKITTRGNRLGICMSYFITDLYLALSINSQINSAEIDTSEEEHNEMATAILVCFTAFVSGLDKDACLLATRPLVRICPTHNTEVGC